MSFFEGRISDAVTRGSTGGPVFKTDVARSLDGRRVSDRKWQYPLFRYDISYGIKEMADLIEVVSFFMNVYGRADAFRYKDWFDFELAQDNSNLTLISGTTWQINRVYTLGSRTFLRPIYKPCASPAPVIYRTRSGVVSVATATVTTTNGQVAMTGHASGDTYSVVGEFDVPVAFVDDSLEDIGLQGLVENILGDLPSIKLEEIRL